VSGHAEGLNLSQIGRLARVGRAAVVVWRRRYADFPQPVGGSEDSPLFLLDDVERWLLIHGMTVPPVPAVGDGAQLAALGIVRALIGGVLARQGLDESIERAEGPARAVLARCRDWAQAADVRTQLLPVACALARTAVAALATTQDDDAARVREWLSIQARTVADALAGCPDYRADAVVIAAAGVVAEELEASAGSGDEAAAAAREARVAEQVRAWVRPDQHGADAAELLMSGGWFAATMLAYAFGFEEDRIAAYLAAHSAALVITGHLRRVSDTSRGHSKMVLFSLLEGDGAPTTPPLETSHQGLSPESEQTC
jgi:hypothetical protein